MRKTSRAKELKDELRQRFEQNATEKQAYDQLKEDPRFSTLRLAKVITIYNQLRTEKTSKRKKKPVIPSSIERIRRTEQLSFIRSIVQCDHNELICLVTLYGDSIDGRFFVFPDRTPTIHDESNASFTDTFSNKSSRIKLPLAVEEDDYKFKFYSVAYDIGLLVECSSYDEVGFFSILSVSLLELDWANRRVQKLQTLTFEDQERYFILQDLIIDTMDHARFLLRYWHNDGSLTIRRGTIVDKEILFEDDILFVNKDISLDVFSLMGNTLYTFDLLAMVLRNSISICTVNLDQGVETFYVLPSLPQRFSFSDINITACLASSRLFIAVRSNETHNYGIVWANFETQKWTEMDFCTKSPITRIRFMADGCVLLVQTTDKITALTQNVHSMRKTLYRVPLKAPEKLANLAWFSLVRSKSRMPNVNPYDESLKYLPLNSEIRSPLED